MYKYIEMDNEFKKLKNEKPRKHKLANVITFWLLAAVILACALSVLISSLVIASRSEALAEMIVKLNVEDLITDIEEKVEYNTRIAVETAMINFMNYLAKTDSASLDVISRDLQQQAQDGGFEYNVVNKDGIITVSSEPENIGFDIKSGEQSSEFIPLLEGTVEEYTQGLINNSISARLMRYAGKVLPDESGFVLVGMTGDNYMNWLLLQLENGATNRRIGRDGYFLICTQDQTVIDSLHGEHNGEELSDSGLMPDPEDDAFKAVVYDTPAYVAAVHNGSYYVIGIYPESEIEGYAKRLLLMTTLLEILVFGLLFLLLLILLRKKVVNNIVRVNDSLRQITAGNLEDKVDVRETIEFDVLSDDINNTVERLKDYIAEAGARIDQELVFAKNIQHSALPTVFPPYPDRKDFSLYACMYTAKMVGGDFYDFYLLNENRLVFLVADVSGKGIPAAMFMMTGKTVLRGYTESGLPIADAVTKANRKLCEGNEAEMFITAWMGILETDTGLVRFVDAGHNAPVLIRNGKAQYISQKHNLILAMMEDAKYREQELRLEPGDILFLYTDGVTEAKHGEKEFFGDDCLLEVLSNMQEEELSGTQACEAVCRRVKEKIDMFSGDTPQFDDITMLCISYTGK